MRARPCQCGHDQFDLMVQVGPSGRVRHVARLADLDRQHRIGGFHERTAARAR